MDTMTLETMTLADIGFGPNAADVIVPESEGRVGNILSSEPLVNLSDKAGIDEKMKKEEQGNVVAGTEAKKDITLADLVTPEPTDSHEDTVAVVGRPKIEKDILTDYLKVKIESGDFFTYDDYDEQKETLEAYLKRLPAKDQQELLDMNISKKQNLGLESAPKEFFESLPQKLQYAAAYVAEGGQDLEGLFLALAKTEQIQKLDPTNEEHHGLIAKNFLQVTNWGTPTEIDAQIEEWKEDGKLEAKVKQFKPKLDQMQEQQAQYMIQQEAEENKRRQQAAQDYIQRVDQVFQKGEIGGMKLSKKDAGTLYYGLTQADYPSLSGKPTNIIGHWLEKIQYVEPDFDHLTEVAWLLSDRDGYKNSIRQQGKNEQTEKVVRQLKDAQYIKNTAAPVEHKETTVQKVNRPRNILARS